MGSTVTDFISIVKSFLPASAQILELQQPDKRPAILLADLDGDQQKELVGAYAYEGETFFVILKKYHSKWYQVACMKGSGYDITDLLAAPVMSSTSNTLIIGWQIAGIWSELDLLQWTPDGFHHLTPKKIYSKMEVEDMDTKHGKDGKYEIALWKHDTGDAYQVNIYRWIENELVQATDVSPGYFKKVEKYYKKRLKEMDSPVYWYYLADAQIKTGSFHQAAASIHKALSSSTPYPSREKLIEMKRHLKEEKKVTSGGYAVVDIKRGDVTGDGIMDTVYLTANKVPNNPLWQNITVVIQSGTTNQITRIPLKQQAGYHPTLFLGDFTGDKTEDILIVIDTGGSGGTIYAYLFSFQNEKMRLIFDSDVFNKMYKYEVAYMDNFKASVTNVHLKTKYEIDLSYKGKEYLEELYDPDGTLKAPIEGWVSPLSGLYPVDFNRNGVYELGAYQNIAGRFNADRLGYMDTMLKWDGQEFKPERQNVAIFGKEL